MDGWTLTGLIGVVVCAMAASGYGQFNTGVAAGYPVALAWVLPVATDAAGLVTARVWMRAPRHTGVRDYAAGLTATTVTLSAISAVLHLLLPSTDTVPALATGGCAPDWQITPAGDCIASISPTMHNLLIAVKILSGAIPSIMVGLMIHLLALFLTAPARARRAKTKPAKATTKTKTEQPIAKPTAKPTSTPATSPAPAPTTAPAASTARHAAAETEPSGATVSSITDASWKPNQWAPAVDAARRIQADDGRELTVTEVIDAVRAATSSGMKRTTAGHLRRAVLAHITSDDTVTSDPQSSSTTTETAEAVGQE